MTRVVNEPHRATPGWTRATILWIGVLSIMAAFQLWRGAYVDGILFLGLVLMLVVDRLTGGRIVLIRRAAEARRSVIIAVAMVMSRMINCSAALRP